MTLLQRIGAELRSYAMFGRDNGAGEIEWFICSAVDPVFGPMGTYPHRRRHR